MGLRLPLWGKTQPPGPPAQTEMVPSGFCCTKSQKPLSSNRVEMTPHTQTPPAPGRIGQGLGQTVSLQTSMGGGGENRDWRPPTQEAIWSEVSTKKKIFLASDLQCHPSGLRPNPPQGNGDPPRSQHKGAPSF